MLLLPWRRRFVVLLRRGALVAVIVAIALIVVVIAVVPRIRRVVFLRWRERTVAIIGSSLVRISRRRIALGPRRTVPTRLARRHCSGMVFPAGCPCRHGGMAAEVARLGCGRDRRAPVIHRGQGLAGSDSG